MSKFKLEITESGQSDGVLRVIYSHDFVDEAAMRSVIRDLNKPARKPRKGKTAPVQQTQLPIKGGAQ